MEAQWKERTESTFKAVHDPYLRANNPDIILLGDSLFERLETLHKSTCWGPFCNNHSDKKIMNAGIGGDKIQNVLYRLKAMGMLDYPSLSENIHWIVLIGTNNIEKDKPDKMIAGVKTIVQLIHSKFPKSKITILSLPPRSSPNVSQSILDVRLKSYNELLKTIPNTSFADLHKYCVEHHHSNHGPVFSDHVHFSEIGNIHVLIPFLSSIINGTIQN